MRWIQNALILGLGRTGSARRPLKRDRTHAALIRSTFIVRSEKIGSCLRDRWTA